MYAKIIVDITHEKLDRVFEYLIPSELEQKIKIGQEVVVPFGKGNREIKGYVVDISDTCEYENDKMKEILQIAEKRAKNSERPSFGKTAKCCLPTSVCRDRWCLALRRTSRTNPEIMKFI